MVTKLYTLNQDAYRTAISQLARPLPTQQRLILEAMTKMKLPATGRDIVEYAVEHLGLQTRQKFEVLYAWYARSNEEFGAELYDFRHHEEVAEEPVPHKAHKKRKAA